MDQPRYHIDIFWSDEDGGYIANVPDLRFCSAFGETYEEALREVLVAMELYLETLRGLDRPIPEPTAPGVSRSSAPAETFAAALRESYEALAGAEGLTAEVSEQLAQDFLIKQQEAFQALAQASANAYMDFLTDRSGLDRSQKGARN